MQVTYYAASSMREHIKMMVELRLPTAELEFAPLYRVGEWKVKIRDMGREENQVFSSDVPLEMVEAQLVRLLGRLVAVPFDPRQYRNLWHRVRKAEADYHNLAAEMSDEIKAREVIEDAYAAL